MAQTVMMRVDLLAALGLILAGCASERGAAFGPVFPVSSGSVFVSAAPMAASTEQQLMPTVSAQRGLIAYAAYAAGNLDIFVRHLSGGSARRLTTHPTDDSEPAFSPDGRYLAWVSQAEDVKGDIWLMTADGDDKRRLTGSETADRAPTFSADGHTIYFSAAVPGTTGLRIDAVDVESGARRTVVEGAWDPAVSPDGRFLFYVSLGPQGRPTLYARRLADSRVAALTDAAYLDAFPRAGRAGSRTVVVFCRYADDQNGDGVIDTADAASLWAVDFDENIFVHGTPPAARPLTAGETSELFPAVADHWIAYTASDQDNLDLFAVPISGIVRSEVPAEAVLTAARAEDRPALRRLALRFLVATSPGLADAAHYELARELAERGLLKPAIAQLRLIDVQGENSPIATVAQLEAERLRTLEALGGDWVAKRPEDRDLLDHATRNLRKLGRQVTSDSPAAFRMQSILAELVLARGEVAQAAGMFEKVAAQGGVPSEDGARALDHLQQIDERFGDIEASGRVAIELARRFASERFYAARSARRWTEAIGHDTMIPARARLETIARENDELPGLAVAALSALAQAQVDAGYADRALETWRTIATRYGGERALHKQALVNLGDAAAAMGDETAAIDAYERLVAESADQPELRARARRGISRIALAKAQEQERRGDWAGARGSYARLLANDQELTTAHRRYIALSARLGERDAVLAQYARQARDDPRDKLARYGYGYALTFAPGPPLARAQGEIEASLGLDPRFAAAHLTLGWIRQARERTQPNRGWLEAAESSFASARELLDPVADRELYAAAVLNQGNVLAGLGKTDAAFKAFLERELLQADFDEPITELLYRESFARVAFRQGELDVALDMAGRAQALASSLVGTPRKAATAALLAAINLEAARYDYAADWYGQAADQYAARNDLAHVVPLLRGEALALQWLGKNERALTLWTQILDILARGQGPREPTLSGYVNEDFADPHNITRASQGFGAALEEETARAQAGRSYLASGDSKLAKEFMQRRLALLRHAEGDARTGARMRLELLYGLNEAAVVAVRAGDGPAAASWWHEALSLVSSLAAWQEAAITLESLLWLYCDKKGGFDLLADEQVELAAATGLEATASSAPGLSARFARFLTLVHLGRSNPAGEPPKIGSAANLATVLGGLDRLVREKERAREYARLTTDADLRAQLLPEAKWPDPAQGSPAPSRGNWRAIYDHALSARATGDDKTALAEVDAATSAFAAVPGPAPAAERQRFLAEAVQNLIAQQKTEQAWSLLETERLLELRPPERRLVREPVASTLAALERVRNDGAALSAELAKASPLVHAVFGRPVEASVVRAALTPQEVLIQAFAIGATRVLWIVHDKNALSVFAASGMPVPQLPDAVAAYLEAPEQQSLTRVVLDYGELWPGSAMDCRVHDRPLLDKYEVVETLSATYMVAAKASRNLSRDGVLSVGEVLPGAINLSASVGGRSALGRLGAHKSMIFLRLPARVSPGRPGRPGTAQVVFAPANGPEAGEQLNLDAIAALDLDSNILVVDSEAAMDGRAARAIAQAALLSGVPTVWIQGPGADRSQLPGDADWLQQSAAALVRRSVRDGGARVDTRLIGDAGVDFAGRVGLAVDSYRRLAGEAIAAFKVAQSSSAAAAWRRARDSILSLLDTIAFLRDRKASALLANSSSDTVRALLPSLEDRQAMLRGVLAQAYLALGEGEDAAALQELVLAGQLQGANTKAALQTALELGKTQAIGKHHSEAAAAFQRCAALATERGDGDSEAQCHERLGTERRELADPQGAERAYQQALVRYATLGSPKQVNSRRYLGILYESVMNNYAKALEQFLAAYAAAEHFGLHDLQPLLLTDVARAHRLSGAYDQALEYVHRAEELLSGGDRRPRATVALEKAKIYWYRGNYRRALAGQGEALALATSAGDAFVQIQATSLRGLIALNQGDLGVAEQSMREALMLSRLTGRRSEEAAQLNNLGFVFREAKRLDEAIGYFKAALVIDDELRSAEGRAYDLRNLAIALDRQGRGKEAISQLDEALAVSRRIGNRYNELQSLLARGEAMERIDAPEAKATFTQAVALSRTIQVPEVEWRSLYAMGRLAAKRGDRTQARTHFSDALDVVEQLSRGLLTTGAGFDRQDLYEDAVRAALKDGDIAQAFAYVERARARALLDTLSTRTVDFPDAKAQALVEVEARAREAVAAARRSAGIASVQSSDALSRAVEGHRRALAEVTSRYPRLARTFAMTVASLADLQMRLGEGVLVVSYFVGSHTTSAFLIDRSSVQVRDLAGTLPERHEKIVHLQRGMRAFAPVDGDLTSLGAELLGPLADRLQSARHVVFVPDASLSAVPFEALTLRDAPLIDQVTVSVAPSATALADTLSSPPAAPVRSVVALAPGADLPFARLEASAVAGRGAVLGPSASVAALRQAKADALDLAAHLDLDATDPLSTALILAADHSDSGRLELRQVFGLRGLPPLVTLSACDSGQSDARGDAWVSMGVAFSTAGARTVLAARQRVSDLAAALLMKRFYRQVGRTSTAQALRAAVLAVRGRFSHPAYWASFELMGDYR